MTVDRSGLAAGLGSARWPSDSPAAGRGGVPARREWLSD